MERQRQQASWLLFNVRLVYVEIHLKKLVFECNFRLYELIINVITSYQGKPIQIRTITKKSCVRFLKLEFLIIIKCKVKL